MLLRDWLGWRRYGDTEHTLCQGVCCGCVGWKCGATRLALRGQLQIFTCHQQGLVVERGRLLEHRNTCRTIGDAAAVTRVLQALSTPSSASASCVSLCTCRPVPAVCQLWRLTVKLILWGAQSPSSSWSKQQQRQQQHCCHSSRQQCRCSSWTLIRWGTVSFVTATAAAALPACAQQYSAGTMTCARLRRQFMHAQQSSKADSTADVAHMPVVLFAVVSGTAGCLWLHCVRGLRQPGRKSAGKHCAEARLAHGRRAQQ